MGKLIASSVKMLYRDKQALFWALMFPIIFTVVFGLFDFNRAPIVHVGLVRAQPTELSATVESSLDDVESFVVEVRSDLGRARRELGDGDLDVVLVLPPEGSREARLYYNVNAIDQNGTALVAVQRVVDAVNLRASNATPVLALETEPISARSVKYYDFLLPGLVAMGVMNFSITGMAIAISRFREQRILKRILATPLAPGKFLAAQVTARLLLSLVQVGLILAVGTLLFGARIYGNVAWLFVLAAGANVVFINIGFAIAGRAANADAAQGVASAVAIPMMFLSGVFFPTDTLPVAVQRVVEYLPLTPLIQALRKVSLEGLSITATGSQVALLGAWMVVSFALARRNFRFGRA